jgi:ferritin-like metal-binding protein YciE
MADVSTRDAKLIQYLNEAYGKEKELETALQAHIGMTDRKPYKKRLQQHLKETKSHARELERRIKKLGGDASTLASISSKAIATAKGPLHMLRGTGSEEKLLKNAKSEYSEEHEEIATYTAIETFAESVNDKETAKLARSIRRDEERMAKYLEGLIPTLAKSVVTAEVPAAERRNSSRRSSSRRSSGSRSKSSSRSKTSSRARSGSSSRGRSKSGTRSRSGSSSARSRSGSGSSSSRRSSGSRRRSR